MKGTNPEPLRPLWLLAELTYSCPLQCPYCSNPLRLGERSSELTTQDGLRVLGDARAADPACDKSPRHEVILEAVQQAALQSSVPAPVMRNKRTLMGLSDRPYGAANPQKTID